MKRAQAFKKRWQELKEKQLNEKLTHENLGRVRLQWYLEHAYIKYQEICYMEGIEPIKFSKWLTQEM